MLTTIEATYINGRIEFSETPPQGQEGRVLVTFLQNGTPSDSPTPTKGQMIRRGMFPELLAITEEDFKAAEYHPEEDYKLAES